MQCAEHSAGIIPWLYLHSLVLYEEGRGMSITSIWIFMQTRWIAKQVWEALSIWSFRVLGTLLIIINMVLPTNRLETIPAERQVTPMSPHRLPHVILKSDNPGCYDPLGVSNTDTTLPFCSKFATCIGTNSYQWRLLPELWTKVRQNEATVLRSFWNSRCAAVCHEKSNTGHLQRHSNDEAKSIASHNMCIC